MHVVSPSALPVHLALPWPACQSRAAQCLFSVQPIHVSPHGSLGVHGSITRSRGQVFSGPILSLLLLLLLGLINTLQTCIAVPRVSVAMGSLDSNQFALKEMFDAPLEEVFGQLCLLGSRYPLSPLTARLEPLTTHAFGIGSRWQEHRLHLFLRDIIECEVLQCKPHALSIISNDGNCSAHISQPLSATSCVVLSTASTASIYAIVRLWITGKCMSWQCM